MKNQNRTDFSELEQKLSYSFKDKSLLQQALTHPSLKIERKVNDYERLEFLGDSIIGFIIAEIIYSAYEQENEGKLAKRKAAIVSRDSLSLISKHIGLDKYLQLSHGEDSLGGRNNPANLENALEALIAAIYLDGGIQAAKNFVSVNFADTLKNMVNPPKDPKSALQEWSQAKGHNLPLYELISMKGPAHLPEITIKLSIGEIVEPVTITAGSKKDAERQAAEKMLEQINGK